VPTGSRANAPKSLDTSASLTTRILPPLHHPSGGTRQERHARFVPTISWQCLVSRQVSAAAG
jgi:hypothetical protein